MIDNHHINSKFSLFLLWRFTRCLYGFYWLIFSCFLFCWFIFNRFNFSWFWFCFLFRRFIFRLFSLCWFLFRRLWLGFRFCLNQWFIIFYFLFFLSFLKTLHWCFYIILWFGDFFNRFKTLWIIYNLRFRCRREYHFMSSLFLCLLNAFKSLISLVLLLFSLDLSWNWVIKTQYTFYFLNRSWHFWVKLGLRLLQTL